MQSLTIDCVHSYPCLESLFFYRLALYRRMNKKKTTEKSHVSRSPLQSNDAWIIIITSCICASVARLSVFIKEIRTNIEQQNNFRYKQNIALGRSFSLFFLHFESLPLCYSLTNCNKINKNTTVCSFYFILYIWFSLYVIFFFILMMDCQSAFVVVCKLKNMQSKMLLGDDRIKVKNQCGLILVCVW